jgi:hypothetical protein
MSMDKIRGTAFVVRFYGDESPTTNPTSTVLGQAHFV